MQDLDKSTEVQTPSTSPTLLKTVLVVTALLIPLMTYFIYQGYESNQLIELLCGIYGVGMSSIASYLMYRQLTNPDRLTIHEKGIIYEFLNIKIRVGWEDIEEVKFDGSKIIQIKLNSPEKVASNSLITQRFVGRTQFNTYTKQILKRTSLFRKPWINNTEELSKLLKEAGEQNAYHIAIPFLESSEIAEKAFNQISTAHNQYQPQYISSVSYPETTEHEENKDSFYQQNPRRRELE